MNTRESINRVRDWQLRYDWDVGSDTALPDWLIAQPLGGTTSFVSMSAGRGIVKSTGNECGFQIARDITPSNFRELVLSVRGVRLTGTHTITCIGFDEPTLALPNSGRSGITLDWVASGTSTIFNAFDGVGAPATATFRSAAFFTIPDRNYDIRIHWRRDVLSKKTLVHNVALFSYGAIVGSHKFTASQVEDAETVRPYVRVNGTGTAVEMTGISLMAA